jgi:hypothetical protein
MAIGATFVGFNYLEAGIVADIQKNIRCLFSTPEGTIPGDRSFGISQEYIEAPRPIAENLLALDVYEKVEKYEPRAVVKEITYGTGDDGQLIPNILIGANEDYEESDEDEDD